MRVGQHSLRHNTNCNPCSELEDEVAGEVLLSVASFVPILGSSRFSARGARSSVSSKPKRKRYSREVVLLSRSNIKSVVRGSNKTELMRKGQVIQCFEFCKELTDKEVYMKA